MLCIYDIDDLSLSSSPAGLSADRYDADMKEVVARVTAMARPPLSPPAAGVTFARARARCLLSGLEYVGSSFSLSLSLSLSLQREAAARRLVNEIASFARTPSLSSPRDSLFGRC